MYNNTARQFQTFINLLKSEYDTVIEIFYFEFDGGLCFSQTCHIL